MPVSEVTSTADVEALAKLLHSADRSRPVVVISRFKDSRPASIDVATVDERVSDLVDVFVMVDGPGTRTFEELMPARTNVSGAAGRVYPADPSWQADPYAAPLFIVRSAADAKPKTGALIAAALRASAPTEAAPGERVPATVRSLDAPHRAEVETEDGQVATVARELLFPSVPIDRLLTVGMALDGVLRGGRYDVSDMIVPLSQRVADYVVGDLVLVEVQLVEDARAVVQLCPGVDVTVSRSDVTSNDLDRVRDLMSRGEVLAARVVGAGPDWQLSMLDVDDDEVPRDAPALLRGGPPWLTPVPVEGLRSHAAAAGLDPAADAEEPEPDPPAPGALHDSTVVPEDGFEELVEALVHEHADSADTTDSGPADDAPLPQPRVADQLDSERAARTAAEDQVRQLTQSLSGLHLENKQLADALNRLERQLEAAREDAARGKRELRKARQASQRAQRSAVDFSHCFLDPEEQLRFEVRLQWARKIPAADKQSRPLNDDSYALGPDFLASLDQFPNDRDKVVEVVVEVLTGIADTSPGREVHQLRTGSGAGDPVVVRDDGATCWRASVQQKSPQARRLHYWRTARGIELSRVVPHDVNIP